MAIGKLTTLQVDVLRALAPLVPPWRLAGGGALVGFHTQHRVTRDLDLFWEARELGAVGDDVIRHLEAVGMSVQTIQHSPGFQRLAVARAVHELLVSKLCALLSRSELRDLHDVLVLLEAGGDLPRALREAPQKDGGFSPVTLAWVLDQFPLAAMARTLGTDAEVLRKLEVFRADLTRQLLAMAKPA